MKKHLITKSLLLISLVFPFLGSATSTTINNGEHGYSIIKNTDEVLEIEYSINAISTENVITEKGVFTRISIIDGYLSRNIGTPELPTFRNLIEVPCNATVSVQIISYEETVYNAEELGISYPLYPVQPSVSKSADPSEIVFMYDPEAYSIDAYNTDELVTYKKGGVSRGVGVGNLVVSPFRYNPVQGTIKLYNKLRFKVSFEGNIAKSFERKIEEYSPAFSGAFGQLINYRPIPETVRDALETYPMTYLIVASDALEGNSDLNDFIAWKEQKGFTVKTNYFSGSDATSTIDNWIENKYNSLSPKPSFVLIVGDESGNYCIKSVNNPASGISRSDHLYGVIGNVSSSNDIPSMYVGRFSVNATSELAAQTDKTLWYERDQFVNNYDLAYLDNVMLVAGVDASYASTYGNPQVLYGSTYYFNDTYTNPIYGGTFGINDIVYKYPASDGSGVPGEIRNYCSAGLAFYNYTAHGYEQGFGDPLFTISNVNSLSNANEYCMVVGNCCLTGSFGVTECFGEAWLNATNKGGIAYIGASMSTLWDEDLTMGIGKCVPGNSCPPQSTNKKGMYDGAMLMEYSDNDAYPYSGSIRYIGLMAVENYGGASYKYWLAYHLFGDPSVMIYFGEPGDINSSHAVSIDVAATTFSVTACPYAYVALSDPDGNLHGAARANSSGVANVTITPFTGYNTAHIVVTAQFKAPYFADIQVGASNDPYLTLEYASITGDYNTTYDCIDVGGTCSVTVNASNTGGGASASATVTCNATGVNAGYVTVNNTSNSVGILDPSETQASAHSISVSGSTPEGTEIELTFGLSDGSVSATDLVKTFTVGVDMSGYFTMDFEGLEDFQISGFDPWILNDADGATVYGSNAYDFANEGGQFAYIAFNPASTTPSASGDAALQPHGGERFGASFSAVAKAPNNDWLISPKVQLGTNSSFTCWVKTYMSDWGLERYRVGVSTTNEDPGSFTIISSGSYLEAPVAAWEQKTFDLSAYDNQQIHLAVNCVSNDAFIFMIDDMSINTSTTNNDNVEIESIISIYPNPAVDYININMGNISKAELIALDVCGKVVKHFDLNESKATIDLSYLSKGIYYLNIRTDNEEIIKKLILVK